VTDILLITLPRFDLYSPLVGVAGLKSSLNQAGYSAQCIDLNLETWHLSNKEVHGHYWDSNDLSFRYIGRFQKIWDSWLEEITKRRIHELVKEFDPKFIGICIFSQRSIRYTEKFCALIKDLYPNLKIVAGGPGIGLCADNLKKNGLIDHYILGEAEISIVEFMKGNLQFPGIDGTNPIQIDNLDALPIPDYRDFPLHLYPKVGSDLARPELGDLESSFLTITGSRGCVRSCTFCNVNNIWPKFRYRSGDTIAEEMKVQFLRHNIRNFQFSDSLINGSLKTLRSQCESLVKMKEADSRFNFRWSGQFICKGKNYNSPELFELLGKSGCSKLNIGVESGSEKVRTHMRKGFSNDDIEYNIQQCEKNNIRTTLLMMVGYPTETEEDFHETLELMTLLRKYGDSGVIENISLTGSTEIIPDTPLFHSKEELGIEYNDSFDWKLGDNTKEIRLLRWQRLQEHVNNLGFSFVSKSASRNKELIQKIQISASP
jgi:anaerobic magnesium-protoporphyrin IX monomethyl ester cyclase